MRRFFISPKDFGLNKQVDLIDEEFHHLKNVCRLEVGEHLEVLDGEGGIGIAEILEITKKKATLLIKEIRHVESLGLPEIHLLLCVPKFQTMDLIIQKSVELGVSSITPLVSERSFVKTISKDLKGKIPRWDKIALGACKQSGRPWPLKILEPATLYEQLKNCSPLQTLFLYEGASALDIKTALEKMPRDLKKLSLIIGAEGGFSPQEVQEMSSLGFRPVTLGALVLRVETACITLASIIQYHFNRMR